MKTKFKAKVKLRKGNEVFALDVGQITSVQLAQFAGKEVKVTIKVCDVKTSKTNE